jgi:hypothetical protein
MRRRVEIPLDENGQLRHVRQTGSHALQRHNDQVSKQVGRRLANEEVRWKRDNLRGDFFDAALRRVAPRRVLGAITINESSSPDDGALLL